MDRLLQQIALGDCTHVAACAGVRVRVVHYAARTRYEMHAHSTASVSVIVRGAYAEESGSGCFDARAGDVLIKPAGSLHANTFADCITATVQLELPADETDAPWSLAVRGAGYSLRRGSAIVRPLLEMLDRLREPSSPDGACELDDALADALGAVSAMGRGGRSRPCWMGRAEREIRAHLHERFHVSDIASVLGLHAGHLSRAFHRAHGCGVSEYIRRLRVQCAADLIGRSRGELCDAAVAAGFSDQAHMTRAFREVLGMTPGAFRRLVAG